MINSLTALSFANISRNLKIKQILYTAPSSSVGQLIKKVFK